VSGVQAKDGLGANFSRHTRVRRAQCSTCERIDKVAVTVDPMMRDIRERELADIAQTLHFLEPPRVLLAEYDFR
jgi:hypothetical protein